MASDHEAANTLVLFPVAVLVLLALGALALDSATLFLGQRRLSDLAASIANDAVAAIDVEAFYDPARPLRLDEARGRTRADQLVASQPQDRSFEAVRCELDTAALEVTVTCTAEVRPVFAPLWPGLAPLQQVRATETAVGEEGGPQ